MNTPTTMAIRVVNPLMMTLLTSACPKWLPRLVENTVSKLSHVTWVGHGVVS